MPNSFRGFPKLVNFLELDLTVNESRLLTCFYRDVFFFLISDEYIYAVICSRIMDQENILLSSQIVFTFAIAG